MLKLIYTEIGLHLERVLTPLELTIAQRVILTMRLGQTLHVEPGRAAFLLPTQLLALKELQALLAQVETCQVTVAAVDKEYVEVALTGCWVSETVGAEEGIFLTTLSDELEALIYKLWQTSQMLVTL